MPVPGTAPGSEGQVQQPAEGTPPAVDPKVAAFGDGLKGAPPAAPPAAPPKDEAPPEPELTGKLMPEDVDDPESLEKFADKDGNIHIPFKAFKTRVTRADKVALKKIFGTDDKAAIIKMKDDYEALVNEKEKQRLAQLSELDREREEKKQALQRADDLEKQLADREERQLVGETERELRTVASTHVDAKYTDYAFADYKKHIRKLDDTEIDALKDEDIDKWFADWAKERPAMAKEKPAPKDPVKEPLNNGVKDPQGKPPQPPAKVTDKTARPGQPNTMSMTEIRAKHGVSW
jgi:hypothetical protein